jgi:hypothetical protein
VEKLFEAQARRKLQFLSLQPQNDQKSAVLIVIAFFVGKPAVFQALNPPAIERTFL